MRRKIRVKRHIRKDGTIVRAHTRNKPENYSHTRHLGNFTSEEIEIMTKKTPEQTEKRFQEILKETDRRKTDEEIKVMQEMMQEESKKKQTPISQQRLVPEQSKTKKKYQSEQAEENIEKYGQDWYQYASEHNW